MPDRLSRVLCLHASIMIFLAFFAGFAIGAVATGTLQGSMDDWRLAHMEPLLNGILLFAVAGCWDKFRINGSRAMLAAWCLVLMGYCNTVFGLMRGLTGAPGFVFNESVANNITAAAGMLGVPLGFIAFGIILMAVLRNQT